MIIPVLRLCVLLVMLLPFATGVAQSTLPKFYREFQEALIQDLPSLSQRVLADELRLSQRLGIRYLDVKTKFTISFDFDDEVKAGIRKGTVASNVTVDSLGRGGTRLNIAIPSMGLTKSFYFQNEKLVSPVWHFARNWPRRETEHFQFWISDTSLFHPEAMNQLEDFLRHAVAMLQFSAADMQLLAREKLIYVFCKDENEIEQLTGYRTRGIFLLPYDYVVTTYNCHYHELLHQLINFKLRTLHPYTHPFLQEGFAVAFGGRGGIAIETIFQSGAFLHKSHFASYRDLLAASAFLDQDASFTYPLSGLYVRFLVQYLGMQRFLNLYRTYSGSNNAMKQMVLTDKDLGPDNQWEAFLDSVLLHPAIRFGETDPASEPLLKGGNVSITPADNFFRIEMKNTFSLRPHAIVHSYSSSKFKEILPGTKYSGDRYLFTADSNEVVIYDLYTNNSIAGYSSGFALPAKSVPQPGGLYTFFVRRDLFPRLSRRFSVKEYSK